MKNKIFIFLAAFILINAALFSQGKVKFKKHMYFYTGMGVDYGITQKLSDYLISSIPYSTSDTVKSFNAGVNFFGGAEYDLTPLISASFEYSYYVRSFDYVYSPAVFDYTILDHQPNLLFRLNFRELKYNLKISAGFGYHFQQFNDKVNNATTLKYYSSGPSVKAEVTFLPKFNEQFMAYVSGFGFLNLYGKLKDDDGNTLKAVNSQQETSLEGYGVGARLGILFMIF